MKLYWKGEYLDEHLAGVPVAKDIYFNGSALVETLAVKKGKILNLSLHLRRFIEGARALLMPAPDSSAFQAVLRRLVKLNRLKDAGLRCRYFRDGALLAHPITLKPTPRSWKEGIRLMTTAVRHYGPDSLQGRLKANSMLPNLLSRSESSSWAEDGLRLTPAGFVAEGAWSNILIEKKGVLYTPPLSEGILEGSTRSAILKRWRAAGKRVKEVPLLRHDLYSADKVWLCSSLRGAIRVRSVDGRVVGN